MTQPTQAGAVLNGLYDRWTADTTLAALVNASRLRIFDGPPLKDRASSIELWVGATGIDDDDSGTVTTSDWATLGQQAERTEYVDVPGAVWVLDGSTDLRTQRATAYTVLAAADAAVRGTNLGLTFVMWAEVNQHILRQVRTGDGVDVVLTFNVRVQTRI